MKVKMIRHTEDALDLLLDTKVTRMGGKKAEDMTDEEKYDHWKYMLDTIRTPFEFVDYIFEITEVSKNFTHQFVRTRTGTYNQRTGRAVKESNIIKPKKIAADRILSREWDWHVGCAQKAYDILINMGAEIQDARGILPSNVETQILAKFNLRTLSDMAKNRLCTRTAGEFQEVFRFIREQILFIHPWAESLLQPSCIGVGKCAFPRHGREHCKWYRDWMDTTKEQEALRIEFWDGEMVTNNPIANDGKSRG